MAARRFTKSAINWAAIIERVPETQKAEFQAFKAKVDGNLRKVGALPEEPPKIDWNHYKSKVPVPGMVEAFQKAYESLKIPYPQDTYASVLDAEEASATKHVNDFIQEAHKKIKEAEQGLAFWDTIPPMETMTLQEFAEYFPDDCVDPLRRPTFWPHRPEDQLTDDDRQQWQEKLDGKILH